MYRYTQTLNAYLFPSAEFHFDLSVLHDSCLWCVAGVNLDPLLTNLVHGPLGELLRQHQSKVTLLWEHLYHLQTTLLPWEEKVNGYAQN